MGPDFLHDCDVEKDEGDSRQKDVEGGVEHEDVVGHVLTGFSENTNIHQRFFVLIRVRCNAA